MAKRIQCCGVMLLGMSLFVVAARTTGQVPTGEPPKVLAETAQLAETGQPPAPGKDADRVAASQTPESLAPAQVSVPAVGSRVSTLREKIEKALEADASVDFLEAPLADVAQYIRDTHQIPVIIDKRALDDVGLGGDTPVTISLKGASLRAALRLMLKELDLTYVVRDEVLKITTPEEAEDEQEVRLYPVADLAHDGQPPLIADDVPSRYDMLMTLIQTAIAPDAWDQVGGAGSVVSYDPWGILAVSQDRRRARRIGRPARRAAAGTQDGLEVACTNRPGGGQTRIGTRRVPAD